MRDGVDGPQTYSCQRLAYYMSDVYFYMSDMYFVMSSLDVST